MDQPLFSSSVVAIVLVLLVTFFIGYKKSKPNKNLPPGPWRLPIIGNIHQVINSLPHRKLTNMAKKYGPMMHLQLGQVPYLIVSSAEAAMEVMKNHDLQFAGRPTSFAISTLSYNCKDIAFGAYGDYWRCLRKICTEDLLSAKRVRSFGHIREDETSSMVESIRVTCSRGSTVDIRQVLLTLSSNVTARASFGKSSKERNAVYAPLVGKITEALGGFSVADFFPSIGFLPALTGVKSNVLKLYKEMDRVLQSIIDEHREGRVRNGEADNLLDVLLDLQDHGCHQLQFPLTTDHIKAIIFDLFSGAIATTSTTVEWTMSELMTNPTTMRKVQTELRKAFKEDETDKVDETKLHTLKYFDAVIKESLRMHPPFALYPRKVRENVKVNGYEIPIDTTVLVNAWAIGRDPKYWSEPEEFRPDRFLDSGIDYKGTDFQLLPFGGGRRVCVGMLFGIANVEVAAANLLYHFDWELANVESLDMSETYGLATGRKVALHLKTTPWRSHHG